MIGNYSARLTGSKRNLLALLASSVVFSAGCSNMSSTAPVVNSLATAATLSGKVHGGNQPVIGATVTLWFAGQGARRNFRRPPPRPTAQAPSASPRTPPAAMMAPPPTGPAPRPADRRWSMFSLKGGNTQNNGVVGQNNTAAAFIALYGIAPTYRRQLRLHERSDHGRHHGGSAAVLQSG